MTGSLRIDGPMAMELDKMLREYIQKYAIQGSVKVLTVSRNTREVRTPVAGGPNTVLHIVPYYDITFQGVLELLAGETHETDQV